MIHRWKDIKDKLPSLMRERVDAAVQRELEDEAYPKMRDFLETYGFRITTKLLIAATQYKIKTGKPYLMGAFALEVMKGFYSNFRDSIRFE